MRWWVWIPLMGCAQAPPPAQPCAACGDKDRQVAELKLRAEGLEFENRRLVDRIGELEKGPRSDAPFRKLEGKISAVSSELRLVILDIGAKAGVLEGDEFTVFRDGAFVARFQIERLEETWSSGRVLSQTSDPKPGDRATNH